MFKKPFFTFMVHGVQLSVLYCVPQLYTIISTRNMSGS